MYKTFRRFAKDAIPEFRKTRSKIFNLILTVRSSFLERLTDCTVGPLALFPVSDYMPRRGAVLNSTILAHVTVWEMFENVFHRLAVRNLTLLPVALVPFLTLCRVNQNY